MRSKRYTLELFKRSVPINSIEDLTNRDYNQWVEDQLRSGVSGRSINTRTAHVLALLRFLKDMDYAIQVRMALIPKVNEDPPRRVFFDPEEISRAKRAAKPMELLLISLGFDAGLRISEIASLHVDNISGCAIRLVGKGRKSRQTFVTLPTSRMLDAWIRSHGVAGYVFPSPFDASKPLSIDQIRRIMRRAFDRAGIENFYPHALRHSFGTALYVKGAPPMAIKELMGHSSIAVTENYLHQMDNQLAETYRKYMPITSVKTGGQKEALTHV